MDQERVFPESFLPISSKAACTPSCRDWLCPMPVRRICIKGVEAVLVLLCGISTGAWEAECFLSRAKPAIWTALC